MSEVERESPGWAAIDAACAQHYGEQEPRHWGTVVPALLGGNDPIDGISAYDAGDHWHFVTYGYSELHQKETDDAEYSGFGMEMTFRLKKEEPEPPVWACNLLQNLARYVFSSGNVFLPGHTLDANGPIAADRDTAMTCLLFAEDPQLGSIDTPFGRVQFIQAVGITKPEKLIASSWNGAGLIGLLRLESQLLVTDLSRSDRSASQEWVEAVAAGKERDGSSMGVTYAPKLAVLSGSLLRRRTTIQLPANSVPQLIDVLPGRLPFGRPHIVKGAQQSLRFEPGDQSAWSGTDDAIVVMLTDADLKDLVGALRPERGKYGIDALPKLEIEVIPTEIRDQAGNVVQVIG